MDTESILYFHPAPETMYKNDTLKRHWWQRSALQGNVLFQEDSGAPFMLTDCPVPSLYYRKKPWPSAILLEAMENVLQETAGMADALLHPQIMTYMSETNRERWEPRRETMETLMRCLLSRYAADRLYEQGEVTVLLGPPGETAWQMEMTARLLWPYLSRINRLRFFYEAVEGADLWEEMADQLEEYSYEYGLTPGCLPYEAGEDGYQCGREKCGGVILDFGAAARCPRIRPKEGVVYADLCSDQTKEAACARKGSQILYVSPLKYLDTAVKNSYHRKM